MLNKYLYPNWELFLNAYDACIDSTTTTWRENIAQFIIWSDSCYINLRTLNQFINLWIKHDQILISKILIHDPIREFWSHGLAAEFYMQGLRELVDPGAKDLKPRNFTGVSQGTYLTAMIPKRFLQITEPNTSPTCNKVSTRTN